LQKESACFNTGSLFAAMIVAFAFQVVKARANWALQRLFSPPQWAYRLFWARCCLPTRYFSESRKRRVWKRIYGRAEKIACQDLEVLHLKRDEMDKEKDGTSSLC